VNITALNHYRKYIADCIENIRALQADIEARKTKINEIKLSLTRELSDPPLSFTDKVVLARDLYWTGEGCIPFDMVKQFLNVKDVRSHLGGREMNGECPWCGVTCRYIATSLAGLRAGAPKCETCIDKDRSEEFRETEKRREMYQELSVALAARRQELQEMPYREYLQTPEWRETRRQAIERAKGRCELCNSTVLLRVHHKSYERRGEEQKEDLIVLCESCHAKFHGKLTNTAVRTSTSGGQ